MKSKYASADRLNTDEIMNQYDRIEHSNFIRNIFNSLPHIAAIINSERQVIFSNTILLSKLGLQSIDFILGSRVGEFLNCVNAEKEGGGCGTSENCRYCGAINAILDCQKQNIKIESECTIVSEINGESVIYEFGIVVNPFNFEGNDYYILSLFDISDTKRRIVLEQIFFHDIINKAGSLDGFLQLIKSINDPIQKDEYINNLDIINKQLIKEIFSQKQLMEAENGTLSVNKELIEAIPFLNSLIHQISQHEVAKGIRIELSEKAESIELFTDSSLLGRVILNMLKNAVEATKEGDVVTVNCIHQNNHVLVSVKNPTYMSKEIQAKIFNRSFSTKSMERGLGTYSMKILTEKYLKGKVYFESTETVGTTFYFELEMSKSE